MSEIKIYNLRIVPPKPMFDEIVRLKIQFENKFGKQPLCRSRPHITLAAFQMDVQYEAYLIKALEQLSSLSMFKLNVLEFGIFEGMANTLILKVPMTKAIENIHTQIKIIWLRDLHRKESSLTISKTPHLTISKTISTSMLYESLDFFNEIGFESKDIEINHLTLISRFSGKTWDWKHNIRLTSE